MTLKKFFFAFSVSTFAFASLAASKIQGSLSVKGIHEKDYANTAKITLQDAVAAAMKDQSGKAVSAELDDDNDFLVYEVTVVAPDGKKSEIIIDAGNKSVLATRQK